MALPGHMPCRVLKGPLRGRDPSEMYLYANVRLGAGEKG